MRLLKVALYIQNHPIWGHSLWKTWPSHLWRIVRKMDRLTMRRFWCSIAFFFILCFAYLLTNFIIVKIDKELQMTRTLAKYDGLYWRLIYLLTENEQPIEREMSPVELMTDMMTAQQQLLQHFNVKYNNTKTTTQQVISHFAANLFYFQQFFPLATLQTNNGPKKFIDLSDKKARCMGINAYVNGSWELETQIVRLNPNCHFVGFSDSERNRQLFEKAKNSVAEQLIIVYDEREPQQDDSSIQQVPLLNYLEREFGTTSIDFLHTDDSQNGMHLLRYIFENQHVADPICQLNVPIRRTSNSDKFDKEMRQLIEDLIKQGSYYLMHIEEVVADEQWNFFLVNLFYEECTQKFFSDRLY